MTEEQEKNNAQQPSFIGTGGVGLSNDAVADQLSLLSKLMDIHGENAFKSKSYASAAFAI